jgi:hypothetical protein
VKLDIDIARVEDITTQNVLEKIKDSWDSQPFLMGSFKHYELSFTQAGTFLVAHGLSFKPVDVIQTSLIGTGSLTWNYANFDSTNLSVTVTGSCTVRAFIGAYRDV